MSATLASQMKDAILVNSFNLVANYLEQGCDPNGNFYFPNIIGRDADDDDDDDDDNDDGGDEKPAITDKQGKFSGYQTGCSVSFLFQAIRNCFDNYKGFEATKVAMEILKALLKSGANVKESLSFYCCNIPGYQYKRSSNKTAIEFAVFLKQQIPARCVFSSEGLHAMENVIYQLTEAEKHAGHLRPAMRHVPVSTYNIWQSLLFSETFSDIQFICADQPEEKLFAHKAVLAAASPYFSALFSGGWQETEGEQSHNGIETQNSNVVMKSVLRFIYTGDLNETFLNEHARALLGLASEWQLPQLTTLCEQCCIRSLSLKSAKDTLLLAHLHECKSLKEGCLNFIKRNSAKLLISKKFVCLRDENHAAWKEVKQTLGGGEASESEVDDEECDDGEEETEQSNKKHKSV